MSENNPFNLPESFEESFEHYHVPKQYKNWLVMSDLHFPYHNIRAITESLNYGIQKNIDAILINGDGMDCYQLSKFNPDPRKRNMKEEIDAFGEFLDIIRKIAPVTWRFGNHCDRLEKLLITKAPELLGIAEFNLENLLRCGERKIDVVKDQRIVYIGKLPTLHGHEVHLASSSVNAARSLFLKTKKSALCGHLHQVSQHSEMTIDDKMITTWSVGHLGDPHPLYARINRWTHGCCRVEVNEAGEFEVINLRIHNNKLFRS